MSAMMSEEEALARILRAVQPLNSQNIVLSRTLDRFAARDVFARLALPVFDNSAMDGYAVISSSCQPGRRLRVIGEQPAGVDQHLHLETGEAVRIFTGAPIPEGADAVVMQEDVVRRLDEIELTTPVAPGEFVRRRGADVSEGQKILGAGEKIKASTLGLLASQGIEQVTVGGEPRVAIISTGDELAQPGEALRAGQIYESNAVLLRAMAEKSGASVRSVCHSGDDAGELDGAIRVGLTHDVLIISGGVSVGARDVVKEVLNGAGAEIELWRVAIKPGKPFLFGRLGNCAIFALPGNPVSAFVTFLVFVRPALLRMMGASADELILQETRADLTVEVRNDGDRAHYIRGAVREGKFTPVGLQESHALFGLSRANALLRLAIGASHRAGDLVAVRTLE